MTWVEKNLRWCRECKEVTDQEQHCNTPTEIIGWVSTKEDV